MRWDVKELDSERSLQDKAYDLLGDMILERETDALVKQTEEQKENGGVAELEDYFARQDKRNLAIIDAYFKKQHRKRLLTHTMPKLARIAAIVIAVLSLAGGIALATSHTVRIHMMRLLVSIEEKYTEVQLVEDESASFDIPVEWQGNNYPAYIPSHMQVDNVYSSAMANIVDFADESSNKICLSFAESDATGATNIDTENSVVNGITINGEMGYIASKDGAYTIFWADGQSYFVLHTRNIDRDEAIQIAESVRKIK